MGLLDGHWLLGDMKPFTRLLTPDVPQWKYALEAWPIALMPSALLLALAMGTFTIAGVPLESIAPPDSGSSVSAIFGEVIFAPVVETLFLALGVNILGSFSDRPWVVAVLSALGWGSLHAIFGAIWFFGTVWSFFVFSCAYLAWRCRSFKAGFVAASVPHAFVNLSAMSWVMFDAA